MVEYIPDETWQKLIGKAIETAKCHDALDKPRWVLIMDMFAIGSTRAKSLCDLFGFDPYEILPGRSCPVCTERRG